MPADNPLVGETWYIITPDGATSQAVLAGLSENSVTLVGRFGRRIVVPRRSFDSSWRFLLIAPYGTCAYESCDQPGYLRVQQLGRWISVCMHHLIPGTDPLLPGEQPGTQAQIVLDRCPACGTSPNNSGSGAQQESGYVVHHCGRCSGEWIILIGQGSTADGLWFGASIQEAAAALERKQLFPRCLVGFVALRSLRRAMGDLGEPPTLGPVPLVYTDRLGSNNAVVLGERFSTGIQQLGGPPDRSNQRVFVGQEAPTPDSFWRPRYGTPGTVCVRVLAVSPDQVVTSVEVGSNPNVSERSLQNFLTLYEPVPREQLQAVIGLDHRALAGLPNSMVSALLSENPEDPTPPSESIKVQFPPVGGTWWIKGTQIPVTIIETGTAMDHDRTPFVRVRTKLSANAGENSVMLVTVDEFYRRYIQNLTEPVCSVGDEFVGPDDETVKVIGISEHQITVKGHGPAFILNEVELQSNYKKIVRQSVYSRLLGKDGPT